MGDHSFLAPSSAFRLVECSGSPMLEAMYPELEESEDARNGTASHEAAAPRILAGARANLGLNEAPRAGAAASNGVILTDEMIEAAELYTANVVETMHATRCYAPRVEQRVAIGRIHEVMFGTPDCALYHREGLTLYIWDYKFGFEIVEAFENWQGIAYAAGLLDELGVNGIDDQYITVVIRIVQPRAPHREGPIREWRVKASDLRPYFNRLADAAVEAMSANPKTRAGLHCKYCRARHACETLQREALAAAAYVGGVTPFDLTPHATGLELRLLRRAETLIKARKSGLEEQAAAMIKRGDVVPFSALIQGKGRERWAVPPAEVFALGDMFSVGLRKEPEPITPKQAREAGVPAELVDAYAETPRTGLKLVEDDGRRARQIFSN